MANNLIFLAGKRAYHLIKENGLSPEMVKIIAGAAGGPKWLVLNRFDRALFTDFFKQQTKPVLLVGSSIGAWRFTTMCQSNPIDAQQRFEEAYINQRYTYKPSATEVTEESLKILDAFLDNKGIDEILNHPVFKINFLSVLCKWPSSADQKGLLIPGLILALMGNAIQRSLLRLQFKRTLFHCPNVELPFHLDKDFPTQLVDLTPANYKRALLSSGSIPLVMEGMKDIPGTISGTYRDGGLIDYHLDLPFKTESDEIVLFPHFSQRIVPGWLDKSLKWRKPSQEHMSNVLLVAPSSDYINRLPNSKIPDRNDFMFYHGRDDDRIRDWNIVVKSGEALGDEFMESVGSNKIRELVQPL